jgi:hypothetical protein
MASWRWFIQERGMQKRMGLPFDWEPNMRTMLTGTSRLWLAPLIILEKAVERVASVTVREG